MVFINKKLISLYKNKKKTNIYVKNKSNVITEDVLGKTFIVYNGIKWCKKPIDTYYYINKPIGALRNLESKKISIFKHKKNKKGKLTKQKIKHRKK